MIDTVLVCDCGARKDRNCGKPDCPRTVAVEVMLADIHDALLIKLGWREKMPTSSTDATPRCRWCGQPFHQGTCPLVSAIEYHSNGVVRRVEFWPTKLGPIPDKPWSGEMPEVLKPKS